MSPLFQMILGYVLLAVGTIAATYGGYLRTRGINRGIDYYSRQL
jgi:hypothetical protein